MIKNLLIVLVLVLVIIVAGFYYVVFTEAGLTMVLRQAVSRVAGLSLESAEGRLAGPVRFRGIGFVSESNEARIGTLYLEWDLWSLLALRGHITELRVDDVTMAFREREPRSTPSEGLPEISLPLGVTVQKAVISNISLTAEKGSPPAQIQEIRLGAELNNKTVVIRSIEVITPDAGLSLQGRVTLTGDYPLQGTADWKIHTKGSPAISGSGKVSGTLRDLNIEHYLKTPFNAYARGNVYDVTENPKWKIHGEADEFSIRGINKAWPDVRLSGEISISGHKEHSDITGEVSITEGRIGAVSGEFVLRYGNNVLNIQKIGLIQRETDTRLELQGDYTKQDGSFKMNATWTSLRWPFPPEERMYTSSRGAFAVDGSPEGYRFHGTADVSGTDIPEAEISVKGNGTLQELVVESADARTLNGEVSASGEVSRHDGFALDLNIKAKAINPGIQWHEWPGKLDAEAVVSARLKEKQWTVNPSSARIEGILRGRPVDARAGLSLSKGVYRLAVFKARSGEATLSASGEAGEVWNAVFDIQIPDLNDVYPGSSGSVSGKGEITGKWLLPRFTGELRADTISLGLNSAGEGAVQLDIDTGDMRESFIDVHVTELVIGKQKIDAVSVAGRGMASSHHIHVNAQTSAQRASARFEGGYGDAAWDGKISSFELSTENHGSWALKSPGNLSFSRDEGLTDTVCLTSESSEVCAGAEWNEEGTFSIVARTTGLSLGAVMANLPENVSLDGGVNGNAHVVASGDGTIKGDLVLSVPQGSIRYIHHEDDQIRIPFEDVTVNTVLEGDILDVRFKTSFLERGGIEAAGKLSRFDLRGFNAEQQEINGNIRVQLNALDLASAFTSSVEHTAGSMKADITLGGTLKAPVLSGYALIEKGEAAIPELGVKFSDADIRLTGDASGSASVQGRLVSDGGAVTIQGDLTRETEKGFSSDLTIQGQSFEAVRVPGLWVRVSPDMRVRTTGKHIALDGTLIIPEARIEPRDLSSAVPVSRDVEIVGDSPDAEPKNTWDITSNVKLVFGDRVMFKGFGLDGRITGGVTVMEQPGKPAAGQGELNILDGTYKAYGRELTLDKGRLVFVGLVNDPGLDVRAVRRLEAVTAGVQVRGTLRRPELHVYSDPPMDESDALSYMLFGRPMNGLSGSEGEQLHEAASAAALSGGGIIAKKIGAAFGLEDVEIERGTTSQAAALVVGKYLSPRLYVSYGIGLFEPVSTLRLRYNLSPRWVLQTEHGIESGGDVLYNLER